MANGLSVMTWKASLKNVTMCARNSRTPTTTKTKTTTMTTNTTNAAFLWCRIYRVYDFRVGNNVLVTSELVFTSRELVKKKSARVGEWLATFTLFPLSPLQKAGNNATDRVSCTNYFMSIEIIRCSVRRIKTTKPDKNQSVAKSHCIFSI